MSKGKWLRGDPELHARAAAIYRDTPNVTAAAKQLGISRRSLFKIGKAAGILHRRGPRGSHKRTSFNVEDASAT